MNYFYFDASALVKRYVLERGTSLVNYLFLKVPTSRMMALLVGMGEIISILVRRRNTGVLSPATYTQALAELQYAPPG